MGWIADYLIMVANTEKRRHPDGRWRAAPNLSLEQFSREPHWLSMEQMAPVVVCRCERLEARIVLNGGGSICTQNRVHTAPCLPVVPRVAKANRCRTSQSERWT